jgi:hypothetical protein
VRAFASSPNYRVGISGHWRSLQERRGSATWLLAYIVSPAPLVQFALQNAVVIDVLAPTDRRRPSRPASIDTVDLRAVPKLMSIDFFGPPTARNHSLPEYNETISRCVAKNLENDC